MVYRYLESSLAPAFSKRVFGISAWSQIIVGGEYLPVISHLVTDVCVT